MTADLDLFLSSELQGELMSERAPVRAQALRTLTRLGRGPKILATLADVALSDPDPEVREVAREGRASLLDQLEDPGDGGEEALPACTGSPEDVDRLAGALENPDPILRMKALLAARDGQGPRLLDLLLRRLESERDEWVLSLIIAQVGRLGSAIHVPRIQRFLKASSSPRLVTRTVEAITTLDPEIGFSLITPLLKSEDSRVRACAATAMYDVERRAALDVLGQMAQAREFILRRSALYCLRRLDDVSAERLLAEMLLAEADPALRDALISHLGRAGTAVTQRALEARNGTLVDGGPLSLLRQTLLERLGPPPATPAEPGVELPAAAPTPVVDPVSSPRSGAFRVARSSRIAVPAPLPPPDSRLERFRIFLRENAEDHPWRVVIVGVTLSLLIAFGGTSGGSDESARVEKLLDPTLTLASLKGNPAPARFANRVVRWEGKVLSVDRAERSLQVEEGGLAFGVWAPERILGEIKPGDRVTVTGRFLGKSRLGRAYLSAREIQPSMGAESP